MLTFFFFHDTPTTKIYTLSLHDALPISISSFGSFTAKNVGQYMTITLDKNVIESAVIQNAINGPGVITGTFTTAQAQSVVDRKSTRLNSSHQIISYAVFCLKKKTNKKNK